jgi:hypothetical protein
MQIASPTADKTLCARCCLGTVFSSAPLSAKGAQNSPRNRVQKYLNCLGGGLRYDSVGK